MEQIRRVKAQDVKEILEIYRPFIENTSVSFEMEVPTEADFWLRIQKYAESAPWLVYDINGIIAGYAYASEHRSRWAYRWNREVSVYIHPDFRKRQVATKLYTSLIKLLKYQGYANLLAGVLAVHEQSIEFHEKFGFRKIGVFRNIGFKHNAWCTNAWFELFIGEENQSPRELIMPNQIPPEVWEKSLQIT
jgi:phosphinothricin acetyltransferase